MQPIHLHTQCLPMLHLCSIISYVLMHVCFELKWQAKTVCGKFHVALRTLSYLQSFTDVHRYCQNQADHGGER